MPLLPVQIISVLADVVIFIFLASYVFKLRAKEKELNEKENKSDNNFHHVVDEALAKERKIIEDAESEADKIVSGAQYISQESKGLVDGTLQQVATDVKQQVSQTTTYFTSNYQTVLHDIANSSLSELQNATKTLSSDLQKQIADFKASMLPKMEQELEEYRKSRMIQTEQLVSQVVQRASQEILNKTISLEDHQKLMIEALEKARKEGVFD